MGKYAFVIILSHLIVMSFTYVLYVTLLIKNSVIPVKLQIHTLNLLRAETLRPVRVNSAAQVVVWSMPGSGADPWERGQPARHAALEAPGCDGKDGRGVCSQAALPPETGGAPALPGGRTQRRGGTGTAMRFRQA